MPPCWDLDGDGHDDAACGGTDCDDSDPEVNPEADEVCDGVDNNCADGIDEEPAASAGCDDALFCTGEESCHEGACQTGPAPCPDDGLYCTGIESCDEVLDQCVATGDPCLDGLFCNGAETCDESLDLCTSGAYPCPDDALYCNGFEYCNEIDDICGHTGDPCLQDGLFCNGIESCDEELDQCVSGDYPCPDDALFCNGFEYCNEIDDVCDHTGDPCTDWDDCTDDICEEESDECYNPCAATGPEDPCCDDPECVDAPICSDCWDSDGDGYDDEACGGDDCDDSDPAVNPGAAEVCDNGIDDDCDGLTDMDPECGTIYVPAVEPTIQAGIDAAVDGDIVLVAPGTYMENIDFLGKTITVLSEEGADETVIDGSWAEAVVLFANGETDQTILDGFTIRHGYGYGGEIIGGIHCISSSPMITNCVIRENMDSGVYCEIYASPTISKCTISDNFTYGPGGGIRCFYSSTPLIANCTISDNTADGPGGGIYCLYHSNPLISQCTISDNTASYGGGIYGYYYSDPTLLNSILWGNYAPVGPEISLQEDSTITVLYSDVQGGEAAAHIDSSSTLVWSPGNIDSDPHFIGGGDYHLTYLSPCIDSGMYSYSYIDMDGDARPMGAGHDMGADEYPVCGDGDMDGYGDAVCGGYDCDDIDPEVNPEADEVCDNEIDDDCDGLVDDADPDCQVEFTLRLEAFRGEGEINLFFTLGTPETATWKCDLLLTSPTMRTIPLWSVQLPVIDPPIDFAIDIPLSLTDTVGFYTAFDTAAGNVAYDLKSCHGPYPSSPIEGYASATSVFQGGEIDFHISTDAATYDIEIYRTAAPPFSFSGTYMTTVTDLPGHRYEIPIESYRLGCGWPVAHTLSIPADWPSGVYLARMITPGGEVGFITFVVKEDEPGSTSTILFMGAANNHQAYNDFGGKSVYTDIHFESMPPELSILTRAYRVSFDRPMSYVFDKGIGHYTLWEKHFVLWLESEGYVVEFCTGVDLHESPEILDNYNLFIIAGHAEYWTLEMRENLDAFVDRGGNLAIFAANTCWWQIRLEEANRTLVIYKDKDRDPLYGVVDELVTTYWFDDPLFFPENLLTGVSYKNGGYVDYFDVLPASEGYGDLTVMRPEHWVFEGTGLSYGDGFGWEDTIAGPEVDGALFEMVEGVPIVTGEDGTPLNFQILAMTLAITEWGEVGYGTMGSYTRGSATVFNAATIDWPHGLATNSEVSRITKNVLERLR